MKRKHNKHMDGAAMFKYKSLSAIERRKKIKKFSFVGLTILAIIMFIAVLVVYFVN